MSGALINLAPAPGSTLAICILRRHCFPFFTIVLDFFLNHFTSVYFPTWSASADPKIVQSLAWLDHRPGILFVLALSVWEFGGMLYLVLSLHCYWETTHCFDICIPSSLSPLPRTNACCDQGCGHFASSVFRGWNCKLPCQVSAILMDCIWIIYYSQLCQSMYF